MGAFSRGSWGRMARSDIALGDGLYQFHFIDE
jgi:hypothetical protein